MASDQVALRGLTKREVVVLRRLAEYGSYQQVARDLFVSVNTIKTHVSSIYVKLGVTSREEAVVEARRLGLTSRVQAPRRTSRVAVEALPTPGSYVSEYARAIRTQDWDLCRRLHRADARCSGPLMECIGAQEIVARTREIAAAVPDWRIEVIRSTFDGAKNVGTFECIQSGTHSGDLSTAFGVLAATGKRFAFRSVAIVAFDDEHRAIELRTFWNSLEVLQQLGTAQLDGDMAPATASWSA